MFTIIMIFIVKRFVKFIYNILNGKDVTVLHQNTEADLFTYQGTPRIS